MAQTNILIVGAGAVGAFYASRLATVPDANVSVVCRSNYAAVAAGGFHIASPSFGEYAFVPKHTFPSPEEARKSGIAWDYLVISTKALPDVSDDSVILEGLVQPTTSIVIIQNGIGVEEPYTQRFPSATVLSAVTIVSAAQTEHGLIKHNRWTRISVGPYIVKGSGQSAESESSQRCKHFVSLLRDGGIRDAEAYDHALLQLLRWHKIAINASMNPSSVLSGGSTNHDMSVDSELSRHLLGIMHEVMDTAPKILGRPFPEKGFATPEKILQSTQRNTSGSVPSMQLDWAAGRKMELEVILGNPIRIARDHGIEMPRMQTLYALLKKAQENREKEKSKNSSQTNTKDSKI